MEDINDIVREQIQEIVSDKYRWVQVGEKDLRLFQTMYNRRITEEGETFEEYRFRLKLTRNAIKHYKKGGTSRSSI